MLPVVSTSTDIIGVGKISRHTHQDHLLLRQAADRDLTEDRRLADSGGAAQEGDAAGLFGSIGELCHGGFLRPGELQGRDDRR
jgi:hypothetical protein